tara:strand:- start:233 stop:622 length:390 start_codon:yes stop_codon:yes gene_type:complete
MIKGIGIDSVEKIRVKNIFSKYGKKLEGRLLGPNESQEISSKVGMNQKSRYLSNNFACKEAVAKALGLGFTNGVSLKEIEVLRDKNGKPFVQLSGRTKQISDELDMNQLHVTITDTKKISTALVIGESS